MKAVLVINSGSSSIKYRFFELETYSVIATGFDTKAKIEKERMERQLGTSRAPVYRKLERQPAPQKSYVPPFRKKVEPISGDFVIENDLDVPTFIRKKVE